MAHYRCEDCGEMHQGFDAYDACTKRTPTPDPRDAEIARLTTELDKAMASLACYRHRPCACRLNDDGDEVVQWCLVHAEVRNERDALAEKLRVATEALEAADAFLANLGTPGSEPLNSVNGYRDRGSRGHFTALLRSDARDILAIIRPALACLQSKDDDNG